jgi:hypothetical protein
MSNWSYTTLFIFFLLVIGRNIFLLATKLFSAEPILYELNYKELILLGVSISYTLTYIIH